MTKFFNMQHETTDHPLGSFTPPLRHPCKFWHTQQPRLRLIALFTSFFALKCTSGSSVCKNVIPETLNNTACRNQDSKHKWSLNFCYKQVGNKSASRLWENICHVVTISWWYFHDNNVWLPPKFSPSPMWYWASLQVMAMATSHLPLMKPLLYINSVPQKTWWETLNIKSWPLLNNLRLNIWGQGITLEAEAKASNTSLDEGMTLPQDLWSWSPHMRN